MRIVEVRVSEQGVRTIALAAVTAVKLYRIWRDPYLRAGRKTMKHAMRRKA